MSNVNDVTQAMLEFQIKKLRQENEHLKQIAGRYGVKLQDQNCPTCQGSGWYPLPDGTQDCECCNGTGRTYYLVITEIVKSGSPLIEFQSRS